MDSTNWFDKSVELCNTTPYLDSLYEGVYPVQFKFKDRKVRIEVGALRKAYTARDNVALIKELIKYPKFPIDNPYVSIIRNSGEDQFIKNNPEIVKNICNSLYTIGFDKMIRRMRKAPVPSRRMGGMFKDWVASGALGTKFVRTEEDFLKDDTDKILVGNDAKLKKFAADNLGYRGERGLDLVAMIGGKIIVAEAKCLSDQGGSQNNQLAVALRLCNRHFSGNHTGKKVIPVAILDGVCYLDAESRLAISCARSHRHVMSALLLPNFFNELRTEKRHKTLTVAAA